MKKTKPELSIIILSFNVKQLLLDCLDSVYKNTKGENYQVIVVDNDSKDGSLEAAKNKFPQIEDYQTGSNLGFGGGNNYGVKYAQGEAVLFLNPDTKVVGDVIQSAYQLLMSDDKIGAVGCRTELPDGKLDYSAHRGFPTPLNSLFYFLGLAKKFPQSKLFAGYTATHLDINQTAQMDCGSGAFMMVRKKAGDEVGWWDKDYFWNGEDIEFYYSIKEKGWQVWYLAEKKIIHYKGSSSGLWSTSQVEVPKERKVISAKHAVEAMRIFYKKHYFKKYPPLIREFILFGIWCLEQYRLYKINTGKGYA